MLSYLSLCLQPFVLASVTTHISEGADSKITARPIDLGGGHI